MELKFEMKVTEAETNDFKPMRTSWEPYLNTYVMIDVPDHMVVSSTPLETVLSPDGMSHVQAALSRIAAKAKKDAIMSA